MCIYILVWPSTQRKVSYRSTRWKFIDFKLEMESRDSTLTKNPEFRPAAEEQSGAWSPVGGHSLLIDGLQMLNVTRWKRRAGEKPAALRWSLNGDALHSVTPVPPVCVGQVLCSVQLSLPLIIKPMNSCCLLHLIECGVFPGLSYMHY